MTDHLIDLDAVARPDIRVRIAGKDWRIPGGVRSEIVATIGSLFQHYDKAASDNDIDRLVEVAEEIREALHELFSERQSEEEMLDFPRLDDDQFAQLYIGLVNTWQAVEEVADAPRPTRATPRTKNRSQTSRTKSSPRATTASPS